MKQKDRLDFHHKLNKKLVHLLYTKHGYTKKDLAELTGLSIYTITEQLVHTERMVVGKTNIELTKILKRKPTMRTATETLAIRQKIHEDDSQQLNQTLLRVIDEIAKRMRIDELRTNNQSNYKNAQN